MKKTLITLSLFVNYFVFAILLNSVGAVILQVQGSFGVTESGASVLEGFKDLPIAITSFFVASFLPKIGIKRGMILGMLIVGLLCISIPMIADEFWYFKMLFLVIGVAFAIVKIGVFTTIGLLTDSTKGHSSLMSWIEGFFMIGVLAGNVLFSLFVNDADSTNLDWINVYSLLGFLSLLAAVLMFFSPLDESAANLEKNDLKDDFIGMIKLIIKPLVGVFILSVFLYVLIEQSFQTWTPTFYNKVLSLPNSMSIQAGAVLAGAFAIGRIMAGFVLKKLSWLPFVLSCLAILAVCVLVNLPLSEAAVITENTSWFNAPIVVYIFPLMGIFLAPIYPTINSVILSSLPKHMHSAMSGLIVVFSALGGTTGSILTGSLFEHFDGLTAFYMSLIPISLLAISLFLFRRLEKKSSAYVQA